MQVKDIHAAARELPAQLDLKRMPHVVVDDDTERAVSLPRIGLGLEPDSRGGGLRVVARDVTHAAAVSRASLQRRRDCSSLRTRPGLFRASILTRRATSLSTGMRGGRSPVHQSGTSVAPGFCALHPEPGAILLEMGFRASELVNLRPCGTREPTCHHRRDDRPEPPGLPEGSGPMEARLPPDRPSRARNGRCGLPQSGSHVSGVGGGAISTPSHRWAAGVRRSTACCADASSARPGTGRRGPSARRGSGRRSRQDGVPGVLGGLGHSRQRHTHVLGRELGSRALRCSSRPNTRTRSPSTRQLDTSSRRSPGRLASRGER